MIHFIRPLWLWAFLPTLAYLMWVLYSRSRLNPWKKVCDPHLLPALLEARPITNNKGFGWMLMLTYAIGIIALAGPAWDKAKLPVYRDVSSLMLVLDLSPTMLSNDLKPDRLTRAKFKIRDLITAAQNTQMGLVAFTREAFVASPLSKDANTLNGMLDELNPQMMPVSDSDSGEGLSQGLTLLQQANAQGDVLLITASDPTSKSFSAAKKIAAAGDHLLILAMVGADGHAVSTYNKLQELAAAGNGYCYLFSASANDVKSILSQNSRKQTLQDDKTEDAVLWQDAGPWLCLLLIPFLLLFLGGKIHHEKNS